MSPFSTGWDIEEEIMALPYAEFFTAVLKRRELNGQMYAGIGQPFSCMMISDTSAYRSQPMIGMITEKAEAYIQTSAEIFFLVDDKIEINNTVYLVEQIACLTSGVYGLGVDELTFEAAQLRFPKVLSLRAGGAMTRAYMMRDRNLDMEKEGL